MRLTHVHIFLIGWAYYLVIPVITAYTGILNSIEMAWPWLKFVDTGGEGYWALPLYTAMMPVSFYFGDKLSYRVRRIKPQVDRIRLANKILLPIYALLLVLFVAAAGEMLFAGYIEGQDSSLVMGPIATLQMVILFQFILCKLSKNKALARLNMILLFLSSIVLLGMGGRLYVITSLVAIVFYYWNWGAKNNRERRRSLLWIFVLPIPFAIVGMWRFGIFDFNILSVLMNLFTEPFLTSISAFTFMQGGNWFLLDIKKEFFFAFLNVIPSSIWPDKLAFFSMMEDRPFESPFGAMSVVTSSVMNFGFIGGLIFIAFVGFFMGRCRRNAISPISIAFYCYLTGLLMFVFFRDPFHIQVKLVFMGVLLVWLYRGISAIAAPRRGYSGAKPACMNELTES
jgi:oligosaccharide repeat unit polymerase